MFITEKNGILLSIYSTIFKTRFEIILQYIDKERNQATFVEISFDKNKIGNKFMSSELVSLKELREILANKYHESFPILIEKKAINHHYYGIPDPEYGEQFWEWYVNQDLFEFEF